MAKRYDESSVKKLRGIEPVQRLPGMYTRTSDPTHIIQEAIDNAADEALGGHADRIEVTVHQDGSVTVTDNGRGIPVGLHPEEKIPTVELVLTELHAGAKFSRTDVDAAYKFSGGLHGAPRSWKSRSSATARSTRSRLPTARWRKSSGRSAP
jgi:topoisomerase-4 subunit B